MSNEINKALKIAEKMNYISKNELYIPILDGFKITITNKNGFSASNNKGILEQFLFEDALEDSETINDRIDKVINSSIDFAKQNNVSLTKENILFVQDYKTIFDFKIYIQDIDIFQNKFIRQVNAYFVEPKTNIFYQISIAAGPYFYSSENFTVSKISNVEDNIFIKPLLEMLKTILKNIKYCN